MSWRHKTNPSLALARIFVDAQRLKDWASYAGTPKQKEVADTLVKVLYHIITTGVFTQQEDQ